MVNERVKYEALIGKRDELLSERSNLLEKQKNGNTQLQQKIEKINEEWIGIDDELDLIKFSEMAGVEVAKQVVEKRVKNRRYLNQLKRDDKITLQYTCNERHIKEATYKFQSFEQATGIVTVMRVDRSGQSKRIEILFANILSIFPERNEVSSPSVSASASASISASASAAAVSSGVAAVPSSIRFDFRNFTTVKNHYYNPDPNKQPNDIELIKGFLAFIKNNYSPKPFNLLSEIDKNEIYSIINSFIKTVAQNEAERCPIIKKNPCEEPFLDQMSLNEFREVYRIALFSGLKI